MRTIKTLLLSTIMLTAAAASQDSHAQARVTVQGEGTVSVDPDQAQVRFGIATHHGDPEEARAQNAQASAKAMNRVRALGVPDADMKLETLRLQPRQEYDQENRRYVQVGFEAVREVLVTLKELDKLPTLIAEIVQGGANRLNGVTYDIADREGVRQEALRAAALNARAKAHLLTETLGAKLGAVLEINENGIQIPRSTYQLESMARSADAAPEPEAYASGQIEVVARVTVVFEIASK